MHFIKSTSNELLGSQYHDLIARVDGETIVHATLGVRLLHVDVVEREEAMDSEIRVHRCRTTGVDETIGELCVCVCVFKLIRFDMCSTRMMILTKKNIRC